jgi:hypothetical protein
MAQVSGLVFCTVAVSMMFYALAQYHFRADKLLKKGALYLSRLIPIVNSTYSLVHCRTWSLL